MMMMMSYTRVVQNERECITALTVMDRWTHCSVHSGFMLWLYARGRYFKTFRRSWGMREGDDVGAGGRSRKNTRSRDCGEKMSLNIYYTVRVLLFRISLSLSSLPANLPQFTTRIPIVPRVALSRHNNA